MQSLAGMLRSLRVTTDLGPTLDLTGFTQLTELAAALVAGRRAPSTTASALSTAFLRG